MATSGQFNLPGADWIAFEGSPYPLGATITADSENYNFALLSNSASSVTLLLYTAQDLVNPVFQLIYDPRKNKSGPVWHARISLASTNGALYYAYSVDGPTGSGSGGRFDPQKLLLDPYAAAVFFPPNFSRPAAQSPGSNAGEAPIGILPTQQVPFDWGGDSVERHTSDTIIYEMHVKGFTNNPNSTVSATTIGTYLGVIEKIPHLTDLGITIVELMPIFLFDPEPGGDYWGYMPLSFFAPHRGYSNATDPAATINEVKQLVKALHSAGIEVILDVVFNHTTEVGAGGPIYSFRGIDNSGYYILQNDNQTYLDVTGCGNSIAANLPAVRRLVVDSLRYWVTECHIDGFRFDLAGIFSLNPDGSIDPSQAPIIGDITSDPVLANVRLIAEPYDTLTFELGRSFPGGTWSQWNTNFRDTVRQFIIGDNGIVSTLMTRIYGSALDFFPEDPTDACHPYQSINFVDCHDGFTLYDLVSYNESHNEANGPGLGGGTTQNFSSNCGIEGDTGAAPAILSLRKLRIKGMLTILLLSNGLPMFVMGDEFMRTQLGNNNPYNQDNTTSWIDWSLLTLNADIYTFFKGMIAFRKSHPSLGRSRFWDSDITYYGVNGSPDQSFTSHTLAFCLNDPQGFGAPAGPTGGVAGPSIYAIMNFFTQDLVFDIQQGSAGGWKVAVDTSLSSPNDIPEPSTEMIVSSLQYTVKAQSVVVLITE
jgi:glycogen operon protein